ncbi:unnamed protein product [Caenorhabditis bovis]|uniref:Serpentine receptor class gamma n=1 Tax=Caenorhabditis bovis TaxID=2654633 RepID=A0A8S1E8I3_9PELO|nr:unnamed protein product [Caenorhabditis bovis]
MDTFTPLFSFTCFYGAFSILLYILTFVLICKDSKTFPGSFFTLYKANFFYNILTFANSFITVRIPNATCKTCKLASFFEDQISGRNEFPLRIFSCIHYSMAYVQYSMIFLVSANRFTQFFYYNHNDLLAMLDDSKVKNELFEKLPNSAFILGFTGFQLSCYALYVATVAFLFKNSQRFLGIQFYLYKWNFLFIREKIVYRKEYEDVFVSIIDSPIALRSIKTAIVENGRI